jgi:hypothetical protein
MNENNSAGNRCVEELRGLLDCLHLTTAVADENEQLRKPAELGYGAQQPHRLPAARAKRRPGSGQGRGMNDRHVDKLDRSGSPTIPGLPLRPVPRCPASLACCQAKFRGGSCSIVSTWLQLVHRNVTNSGCEPTGGTLRTLRIEARQRGHDNSGWLGRSMSP